MPVFVYGHATGQPFHEEAYSAVVSDLGALLVMAAEVRPGQTLLLTNKVTQEEQKCRVAHVGERDPQSLEVAVEFLHRVPDFWRLTPSRRLADLVAYTEPLSSDRRRAG